MLQRQLGGDDVAPPEVSHDLMYWGWGRVGWRGGKDEVRWAWEWGSGRAAESAVGMTWRHRKSVTACYGWVG